MAKTTCRAKQLGLVPSRGRPTAEWMKGNKPQYYCYGWKGLMTDVTLGVCLECPDYVDKANDDLQAWLKKEMEYES